MIFDFQEDEFVEYKKSFNYSVIESLVAFSNFKGGKVIVGVDQKKEKLL
ncbi:MAG: helix-turn-helix domain-containing protein [Nanoarchaeota archaeon]